MSFLADLVGNAALTGEKMAGREVEQQKLLERQDHESALMEARARTAAQVKLELEKEEAAAKYKRMSENQADIEAAVPAIQQERQLSAAQRLAPSVDGNVLDVIKGKLTPDQLSKYYGVQDTPVTRIDDQITAARKGGMYEMEAALRTSRKDTVDQLQKEWAQNNGERRTDALETTAAANAKKADAAIIAANRPLAGKRGTVGESVEKLTTQWNAVLRGKKDLIDTYGAKRASEMPLYKQYEADETDISAALREKRKRPQDDEDTPTPATPSPKPTTPKPAASSRINQFKVIR